MPGAAQWIATADLNEARIAPAAKLLHSGYRAYAKAANGSTGRRVAASLSRLMHKGPYGGLPSGIFDVVSYVAGTGLAARGQEAASVGCRRSPKGWLSRTRCLLLLPERNGFESYRLHRERRP